MAGIAGAAAVAAVDFVAVVVLLLAGLVAVSDAESVVVERPNAPVAEPVLELPLPLVDPGLRGSEVYQFVVQIGPEMLQIDSQLAE